MANKFLYYLGAGASCRVLPLAKSRFEHGQEKTMGLPSAMQQFDFAYLEQLGVQNSICNFYQGMFTKLAQNANQYGDIDTYAKYLFLMGRRQELNELKKLLAYYFTFVQLVLQKVDSRYLPWLVALLNKKEFPENVKILSWNYDYQLQLAFQDFGGLEDISKQNNTFTYGFPGIPHLPNLDPSYSDWDKLSLIHLNGIAGYDLTSMEESGSVFQGVNKTDTKSMLAFMSQAKLDNCIHFAWETGNKYHSQLMKHAKKMVEDTTHLIVIGYSFPFYNRKIDEQILHHLSQRAAFTKIYYQDPVLDGSQLRSQFGLPEKIEIVHIKQTDNFHIPFEL